MPALVCLVSILSTHAAHRASNPLRGQQSRAMTLTVDATANVRAISPLIYGMNDNNGDADPSLAKEIKCPASRWGGDATTRYNWQNNNTNSGGDWFFMAGGASTSIPSALADAFVQRSRTNGGKAILTIPIIDYINKATAWDCSFPVSIVGRQQATNPYVHPIVNGSQTDAGNGVDTKGKNIQLTTDQILRVHVPNTPAIQGDWVKHMVKTFGDANHGGVAVYQLDNEPGGWANTHRDIHPNAPTYKEITADGLKYAAAIKSADLTASVLGPGDFGWAVYDQSATQNGGLGNAEYYLDQFRQASTKAGKRLLDYFDEHYYPLFDDGVTGTAAIEANRLRSTRSLWDPTYYELNWIGKWGGPIELIPRMKGWVASRYPGTKLAITEYNFGGLDTLNGAIVQTDVLGIFGREGIDLATMWGPPKGTDPAANAFRIYRNYDGKGSAFGNMSVSSVSTDQSKLAIYGATRTSDGSLTLVIINKTASNLSWPCTLAHFSAGPKAHVYRYSAANLKGIVSQPDISVTKGAFSTIYPANSVSLLIVPKN
jgi:Glycoside hydrolase family 44